MSLNPPCVSACAVYVYTAMFCYIGIYSSICNYSNESYSHNENTFELLKIISDIKFILCSVHRILLVILFFFDYKNIKAKFNNF